MKVGQVFDYPADQVVTRGQHALDNYIGQTNSFAGLGQVAALSKAQIKRVQQELLRIGYPLQGGADGVIGRTTKRAMDIAKSKLEASGIKGPTDTMLLRELDAGNRKLIPSEDEKKSVRSMWTGSTTSIQPQPATPPVTNMPVTTGGPIVGSGGATDPMAPPAAAGGGFMAKYESWLKKQAWLPVQLQNPYVAGGIVLGVTALVGYGLYKMNSGAAPAMAGMGEMDALDAMEQAMRPAPKKKRKSRRKSRKSKK